MGLLLSILVGCVGVLELLSSLKRVSNEASISSSGPTTPCLSYHGSTIDNPSFHDSLCGISHSGDIPVPKSARRKLENLHEYSLRVRSELRSFGGSDWSTLSDCSTRDLLSQSRTDSRHSLNFDLLLEDQEDAWTSRDSTRVEGTTIFVEYDDSVGRDDEVLIEEITDQEVARLTTKTATAADQPDRYVRIPTPIPLGVASEISRSNSSLDHCGSFDNESGNEAPTRMSFDQAPIVLARYGDDDSSSSPESSIDEGDDVSSRVRRKGFTRISRSRSPEVTRAGNREQHVLVKSTPKFLTNEVNMGYEVSMNESKRISGEAGTSTEQVEGGSSKNLGTAQKRIRSSRTTSTVLRKPTRLKSKNAEISKSADNLTASGKRTKRQREPERRRSDISVQTIKREDSLRDEWTNTSPTDSEASIYASRTSVSVEVQTSFDDQQLSTGGIEDYRSPMSFEMPVIGLSESRRDDGVTIGRKAFKNRRFANAITTKSRSLDDYTTTNWAPLEIDAAVVGGPRDSTTDNRKKLDANEQRSESNGWRSRGKDTIGEQKRTPSFTEEDSIDEEFLDAEEASTSVSGGGPIEYCIPCTDESDKPFWLIFSGEYTKAMNKDWHSGHFCCWQCDESLTGQRYVLRDEHPYCIKCYESVFANGCEECSKIIGIDSKDLSYKDKHWHEACFLCNKCRVSLVDKQFGSKVDKIYCGNCYDAQFASRCDGCGEIFRAGTKKMEYKTRQWHEKCFCCVVCKAPIGTKSFIPREQEIYCAGCYEDKFATRCVKCNKIITSGGVTYKNEPWHRDCFTCSNCNNSLAGQRFTSRDEKPYCAECFGELFAKRCTACTKPITGIGGTRFISFEDRHWHNNCFICAGCNTSLVGRGFITDGDDIICPECAKQKLSE